MQSAMMEAQGGRGVKNHLGEELRPLYGLLLDICKHVTLSSWALFLHL